MLCLDSFLHFQEQQALRFRDFPRSLIDAYLDIARREKNAGPERQPRIRNGLAQLLIDETTRFGCRLPHAEILEIFAMDLELNAQGLVVWLDGQR